MANEPFLYFARGQSSQVVRPFKPLTIRAPQDEANHVSAPSLTSEPPSKKRRIRERSGEPPEDDRVSVSTSGKPIEPRHKLLSVPITVRQPLEPRANPPAAPPRSQAGQAEYYRIVWRKFTNKKNKTWDGDGILTVVNGQATLQDESGHSLGRMALNQPLQKEGVFSMAGKEVEIDSPMTREEFLRSRVQGQTKVAPRVEKPTIDKVRPPPIKKPVVPIRSEDKTSNKTPNTRLDDLLTRRGFRQPLKDSTVLAQVPNSSQPTPRHDPKALGALVMKRPVAVAAGQKIVDVVVDPHLSKKLREHQRVGVNFLYECLMGMKSNEVRGAILAHEMGLGKTLTTIALIWTLLKQNPLYGEPPVVKKVMIVCPVTLIENWRNELVKWLGRDRIGVYIAGAKNTKITDFTRGTTYNVCIIGYERLRTIQKALQKGAAIDLVVADEGHRLKTATNKAAAAIEALNTEKKIILSGTPIQNNLGELFHMVNFVNPNLLGKWSNFKRDFEVPIDKGREPNASLEEIQKGEERSVELQAITDTFTHRRGADILDKYLPPKTEYVIFCRPTSTQVEIYKAALSTFGGAPGTWDGALPMINLLKKICNSPSLLENASAAGKDDELSTTSTSLNATLQAIPNHLLKTRLVSSSGKMGVLDRLLFMIRQTTQEKVVLVSNYTSTLDLFVKLLANRSYPFLRLDGSTNTNKRQALVDAFNHTPASQNFAFVLSAKAGGMGLNLIGASRLILFDCDWNPSTDLQAMARVHRDGQKKEVRIYRLLTNGCLDEKIFQRQCEKRGLADRVMDGKAGKNTFSKEELRDLFRIDESSGCRTHELLACDCKGLGHSAEEIDDDDDDSMALDGGDDSNPDIDEDEGDLPDVPELLLASQVNMEKQEAAMEKRKDRARRDRSQSHGRNGGKAASKKAALQSLMAYSHIDCSADAARRSSVPTKASEAPVADPGTETSTIVRVRRSCDGYDPYESASEQPDADPPPAQVPVQERQQQPDAEEETVPTMEGLAGLIEDNVLLRIAQRCPGMVDFVFAKTSAGGGGGMRNKNEA